MTERTRFTTTETDVGAAAEETAGRIMGEKFGIAAGRRLRLVVDTPGPYVARPKVNSIRNIYYFYNAQISLKQTFLPHSSVCAVLLCLSTVLVHVGSGFREKTTVAPTTSSYHGAKCARLWCFDTKHETKITKNAYIFSRMRYDAMSTVIPLNRKF